MVAVLGHLDVVPEGEGWHHPPYAAEIEDGRLYGRGSIDDKGPVVASLFALKAIRDLGIPLNRRVRLLFGLNEETNDRDVLYYKAHGGEIPVLGFTPDGEYPLINGEKGILNESYAVQLHQTGAWQLNRVQGGVAGNVVPDYACAVLTAPAGASLPEAEHITVTAVPGGYQVEAVGVSAHGSHPEQGENAIGRLVCYLDRLPLEGDAKQAVHFLAEKLGTDPYGERLLGHRLEDALSGPMSCNWGLIEGDAQHLWVKLNYRYPVTMERADCQPAVQAAFEAAGWALDGQVHKEELYYPAETPLVSALLEVYRDATGDNAPPKCGEKLTVTDADGNKAFAYGDAEPQPARTDPTESLQRSLSKTGGTPFAVEKIDVEMDGGPWFVPGSAVNELRREALGDIVLPEDQLGVAYVFALEPAAELICQELRQAGNTDLTAEMQPLETLPAFPQAERPRQTATVSSLRLDAVAASGFSLSRGKAADLIASGRVQLNHRECVKPDHAVAQGDVLSCRGLGKCVLTEVGGPSKKGRILIVLERYV